MSLTETPARPPAPPVPLAAPRALLDYDFQTVLRAPPKQRLVLWLMLALLAAAGLWLALARVDIIISANGRLVTSDNAIVVQPLETSVVRQVRVRMGDRVKKGQVLAVLDPTFTQADVSALSAKLAHLQSVCDRLSAEFADRPYAPADPGADALTQRDIWQKRQQEYAARLAALDRKARQYAADLAAHQTEAQGLAQQIKLSSDAQGIYQTLVAQNLASRLKLIDTSEHLVEARSRLATNLGEQRRLQQQIAENTAERAAFVAEWQRKLAEELAKTRAERDGTAAQLEKARLRRTLAVLRAPADATVLSVADRPQGAVVREAEPLFRLVPADAPLVAEIDVETRDVARLTPGDPVTVKFEALPWEQFGLARGVLKTLAPDTEPDRNLTETAQDAGSAQLKQAERESPIHYRARVALVHTELRNLPPGFAMRPGMRLVADIKVGRRSLLQYILNPITRIADESLREP
ncbi:MAG TPA: HlyD family type I secretion periplasmic adaptor subunit [Stellaceae bacterium]|nr:HlyD family type I secretion periplasmic adaptor subunit [Stellaceae bacterium]